MPARQRRRDGRRPGLLHPGGVRRRGRYESTGGQNGRRRAAVGHARSRVRPS